MTDYPPLVPERRHLAWAFKKVVETYPNRLATRVRAKEVFGAKSDEPGWVVQTFRQLDQRVDELACALMAAGVARGDRVVIFGRNSPQWSLADYACQVVGAVSVPIYATSTVTQTAHILRDCGAVFAFAGTAAEARTVQQAAELSGRLAGVVSFEDTLVAGATPLRDFGVAVTDDLRAELAGRLDQASPDDLFSLIYTSGTTGDPRGVMLTHENMLSEMDALDDIFGFGPEEHSLCFLPLSHALERTWTLYVMRRGCLNTYCPDTRKVAELLVEAKPTLLVSVPRLYETVLATARGKVAGNTAKKKIFEWAVHVGGQMQHAYRKGSLPSAALRAQFGAADRLVLKAVRDAMGGPKVVMACGGAPLRTEVELFFSAIGMPILPGYGLTEAAPLVSFNRPDAFKVGTAGIVMRGGEIRIGDESEILYRGPNVMVGYWNNPAATAAMFTGGTLENPHPEGAWLKTGDAGYVDNDGFLVITDRLKDIIVTQGGKNIAPQPIEGMLMADPLFEQAILLGDNRPYLTLLVKPSLPHLNELATQLKKSYASVQEQLEDPEVIEVIKRRARAVTDRLPSQERFKDLRVLWEDFTMENGLLTPTLKVRRREVEKRFAEVIDDMYAKYPGLAEARARVADAGQDLSTRVSEATDDLGDRWDDMSARFAAAADEVGARLTDLRAHTQPKQGPQRNDDAAADADAGEQPAEEPLRAAEDQ